MTAAATYLPAPEVAETAVPLIAEFHSELADAPIVYAFRNPPSRARDKLVLGRAIRVLGLNAFLVALAAGDATADLFEAAERDYSFFVMEIALGSWQEMTVGERRALVDHELCHFRIDPENGELKIRAHDVEEFIAVAHRHGAWTPEIAVFVEACATPA